MNPVDLLARLWPGWDALWPNILATIICGSVAWLWARRHIRHINRKLDRIHQHLGVEDTPPKPAPRKARPPRSGLF